jgi:hypothetical protein
MEIKARFSCIDEQSYKIEILNIVRDIKRKFSISKLNKTFNCLS